MDMLPKRLNAYLIWLILGLIFLVHVFVWEKFQDRIELLDNSFLALWAMITTCILLMILISWLYLFLKSRLYVKHLLEYDPNYFDHAAFSDGFHEALNNKEKS